MLSKPSGRPARTDVPVFDSEALLSWHAPQRLCDYSLTSGRQVCVGSPRSGTDKACIFVLQKLVQLVPCGGREKHAAALLDFGLWGSG